MPKPLRQSVELPVGEDSISLDITFRIIEIVERHYDLRADFVTSLLQEERGIRRMDIAQIIMRWIDTVGVKVSRDDIYAEILTAPEATLRKYVGAIQGAISYSLREITVDELRALVKGEDIRQGKDGGKKKTSQS